MLKVKISQEDYVQCTCSEPSMCSVTMASFRPRLQPLDSQPPSMPGRFGRFEAALGSLERKANVGMPNERHFARNLTGRDSNKRQLTIP